MRVNVLAFRQTTFGQEWRRKVLPMLKISSNSDVKSKYIDLENVAAFKKAE